MKQRSTSAGLVIAVFAALAFGMSGAVIKPLLEAGWSPTAAVMCRAFIGGLVLLVPALVSLRGRWDAVWRGRWRILAMGGIGVAATQLVYFSAVERIPVSTAVLIEYMAPLLLVAFVWATSRRIPKVVVLIGSVVSVAGLVLVVSPGAGDVLDVLGLVFAGACDHRLRHLLRGRRASLGRPAAGRVRRDRAAARWGAAGGVRGDATAAVHDDVRRGRRVRHDGGVVDPVARRGRGRDRLRLRVIDHGCRDPGLAPVVVRRAARGGRRGVLRVDPARRGADLAADPGRSADPDRDRVRALREAGCGARAGASRRTTARGRRAPSLPG